MNRLNLQIEVAPSDGAVYARLVKDERINGQDVSIVLAYGEGTTAKDATIAAFGHLADLVAALKKSLEGTGLF